jgi:hypothetical protein
MGWTHGCDMRHDASHAARVSLSCFYALFAQYANSPRVGYPTTESCDVECRKYGPRPTGAEPVSSLRSFRHNPYHPLRLVSMVLYSISKKFVNMVAEQWRLCERREESSPVSHVQNQGSASRPKKRQAIHVFVGVKSLCLSTACSSIFLSRL